MEGERATPCAGGENRPKHAARFMFLVLVIIQGCGYAAAMAGTGRSLGGGRGRLRRLDLHVGRGPVVPERAREREISDDAGGDDHCADHEKWAAMPAAGVLRHVKSPSDTKSTVSQYAAGG
jgi:hypothetical protein